MNRATMKTNLALDLGDVGGAQWDADELNRVIARAVDDLNRVAPREGVYEATLDFDVEDEAWTADSGAAVSLTYPWIEWASETVTDSAGTEAVRDTDYTIDYAAGTITALTASTVLTDEEVCAIDYTRSKIMLDLSDVTDLMQVRKIEYPYGKVPIHTLSGDIWNDWLMITTSAPKSMEYSKSQEAMSDGDHVQVYYTYAHTAPTDTVVGTFSRQLDEVVTKGAAAYAFLMLGAKQDHVAETRLESAATALGNIAGQVTSIGTALTAAATPLGDMETALDKCDTYLAGATNSAVVAFESAETIVDASGDVKTDLDAIAGSATDPFEEADVMLDSLEADQAIWTDHGHRIEGDASNVKGADWHLQNAQAEGKINTVTTGMDVAVNYVRLSGAELAISGEFRAKAQVLLAVAQARLATGHMRIAQGQARINQAAANSAVGQGRLGISQGFINEASSRYATAQGFIAEANTRVGIIAQLIQEALEHERLAGEYQALGTSYKREGWRRHGEFMRLLRDRTQRLMKRSRASVRQPS